DMVKGRTQSREGASMSSHDTMNPTGGVSVGHVIEPPDPNGYFRLFKELKMIIQYLTMVRLAL
ncbi:MAG: hypothetical protein SV775_19435, partial [Thermodesulfobacteriota bacterium]|nr:hypothetical protein [Thermodesulfobacteriota bacterium]